MKHRGIFGQVAPWGLAVLFAHSAPAVAGSFVVNPVRLTLSANQTVGSLTVRNVGEEATVVQLETQSWTQHDGKDELSPSSEILATPPIITVPPGGSRIVRVGLRRPADQQRELTYRLLLREVPPPQPVAQGLRVALLISMPVFVAPPHVPGPQLKWQAVRLRDGNIELQATNSGQSHIQLGQLHISTAASGSAIATHDMADYLLPGNSRKWIVTSQSAPPVGTQLNIISQADVGPVKATVVLAGESRELTPTTPETAAR